MSQLEDRQVLLRILAVERGFLTNGADMDIDGDWERGPCRELIQGWCEDFAALWTETMDEANLQEKEVQAASQGARFYLLSWNRCVHTCGAATDKEQNVL